MIEQLLELMKEMRSNPEFFGEIARCYSGMRDELVKEGFSREEAVEIVINKGFGIKPN